MKFNQIFTSKYLLDPLPPQASNLYVPLLIFFVVLVIIALVILVFARDKDKIVRRFYLDFMVSGVSGLIYLFGRYERLPWLGSRLWILATLLLLFFWSIINIVSAVRYYPKFNKEKKLQERYEKYLPKPKKGELV